MHVKVPSDIRRLDQLRQFACSRCRDLPRVLPQFRRDEGQPQRLIDLLLGLPGHTVISGPLEHAVLVHLVAHLDGDLAHLDVVLLGPGEVLQGGAVAPRLDDP